MYINIISFVLYHVKLDGVIDSFISYSFVLYHFRLDGAIDSFHVTL